MKFNKHILLTLLGLLLIAGGLFVAFMPTLTNNQLKAESNKVVNTFEKLTEVELEENIANEETVFNYDVINNISATKTLINKPNFNAQQIIGQMVIPELDINLSLFNSLTDGNLLAGVTTMKPGQVMGQGNYTIAGHYTDGKGVLLNRLLDAQKGQIIRLTNRETIFEYSIIDLQKVSATQVQMLSDNKTQEYGQHIVSIMSCYYYDTDHRWFVIGGLVDTYPYSKEAMIKNN